jgi:anti-sigma-K factor RskA
VNIKEYISSGILEAYALGDLTEQERAEVEKNLAQFPEIKLELSLIEEAQEKMLIDAALKPGSQIKHKLLAKIDQQMPQTKMIQLEKSSALVMWRLAAAASISIAIIASYMAYNYRSKWKSTASDLSTLAALNQQMAQDYNHVNQRIESIESSLKIMDSPNFKKVVMKGTQNAPEAVASVYWNESSHEVYLSMQQMKELAREKQYQLWAIIDGKPVDAGVFDRSTAGLIKMKNITSGVTTFAVTIEPRGGKSSPTLEAMQVAGNVIKG